MELSFRLCKRELSHTLIQVSILVIMELSFRLHLAMLENIQIMVSILVIMELSFRPLARGNDDVSLVGFNPCYNGVVI